MDNTNVSQQNIDLNNATGSLRTIQTRASCPFGVKCYRKNSSHLAEMAHIKDADFKLPPLPQPNANASQCKYGSNCYRLNPTHYQNFKHPADSNYRINVLENYKCYHLQRRMRRRTRRYGSQNTTGSDFTDDEDEEPFATDSDDSDYIPSDE